MKSPEPANPPAAQPDAEARPTWLFVLPWALGHPGGVNEVVKNLYRACLREGSYRPLVMVCDWSAARPDIADEGGFRILRLRLRPPPETPAEAVKCLLAMPRELWRLAGVLRAQRVAVVNVHYPSVSALDFQWLRRLGLYRGRLILSFHLTDLKTASAAQGMARRAWRHLAHGIDAASGCSAAIAAEVRRFLGPAGARVGVVYNGVDTDAAKAPPEPAAFQLPGQGRRYLLNVATYERKKGQDVLIRAFSMLAAEFLDVDLILIGRDGSEKTNLDSLVEDLGLGRRVHLLPAMDNREVLAVLRAATLFVLASRDEGFPVSLLEAGALGIPVVATRVGGVAELIPSDALGLLVEPEDSAQLAGALRRLLDAPDLASALGRALQARVRESFSWQRSYASLLELAAAPAATPSVAAGAAASSGRQVALLTPYTGTNLGDTAIFQASMANLRAHLPGVRLQGLTLYPEQTARIHDLPCRPATGLQVANYSDALFAPQETRSIRLAMAGAQTTLTIAEDWRALARRLPLARPLALLLRRVGLGVRNCVHEAGSLVRDYRLLGSLDAVVACGGGQLDDEWGGPWGQPYTLFRWALLARLRGRPMLYTSVGACRLASRLSWFFIRHALALASYRSYRDPGSLEMLSRLAFTARDGCVADTAFSLDRQLPPPPRAAGGPRVVGIAPIAHGKPGASQTVSSEVYESYMNNLVAFAAELLRQGCKLRIFHSTSNDRKAVQDFAARIAAQADPALVAGIHYADTATLDALLAEIAAVDMVVASRLHGVILAHRYARPTLAVSYDRKVDAQMHAFGQDRYLLHMDTASAELMLSRFKGLSADAWWIGADLARRVAHAQADLAVQNRRIAELIAGSAAR